MVQAKPLREFPDYDVLETGLIVRRKTGRALKATITRTGHLTVGLFLDGKQYTRSIGRLIAETFLDPPTNLEFNTPLHRDGDLQNCAAQNLMWRPLWFVRQYHEQFRTMYYKVGSVRDRRTKEEFENCYHAAAHYGALPTKIYFNAADFESGYDDASIFPHGLRFEFIE